jgi:hypothetical protein
VLFEHPTYALSGNTSGAAKGLEKQGTKPEVGSLSIQNNMPLSTDETISSK